MKLKIIGAILAVSLASAAAYLVITTRGQQPISQKPFATFFEIHLEVGRSTSDLKHQENYWPTLIEMVELADNYGYKITLSFSPQWAEYISKDTNKFNLVKSWQANGHEVNLHHHGVTHGGWNGYTDGLTDTTRPFLNDPRYRGSIENMMKLVRDLASPYQLKSAVVAAPDSDYPAEIIYDTDGMYYYETRSKPAIIEYNNVDRIQVKFGFPLNPKNVAAGGLDRFKEEYEKSQADEVFGVCVHEINYADDPTMTVDWFEFIKSKGHTIKTVSSIIEEYEEYYTIERGTKKSDPVNPDDVP